MGSHADRPEHPVNQADIGQIIMRARGEQKDLALQELYRLTGQRFTTQKEAIDWWKQQKQKKSGRFDVAPSEHRQTTATPLGSPAKPIAPFVGATTTGSVAAGSSGSHNHTNQPPAQTTNAPCFSGDRQPSNEARSRRLPSKYIFFQPGPGCLLMGVSAILLACWVGIEVLGEYSKWEAAYDKRFFIERSFWEILGDSLGNVGGLTLLTLFVVGAYRYVSWWRQ